MYYSLAHQGISKLHPACKNMSPRGPRVQQDLTLFSWKASVYRGTGWRNVCVLLFKNPKLSIYLTSLLWLRFFFGDVNLDFWSVWREKICWFLENKVLTTKYGIITEEESEALRLSELWLSWVVGYVKYRSNLEFSYVYVEMLLN